MRRALGISAAVVVIDQLTKWAAVRYLTPHLEMPVIPFLNLTLIHNRGAAFGFLNDAAGWQNLFFIGVALVACVAIVYLLYRLERGNVTAAVGFALILGGAAGNLIDRLLHGYVIDFIDVYYRAWHWPAFNGADSAITIGAAALIFDALEIGRNRPLA
jgi:signal peptidase II